MKGEDDRVLILVVVRPGHLREALCSLLAVTPHAGRITTANDGPSALRIVEACSPGLVVLDFGLPGNDALTILEDVRVRRPECRRLVLADTTEQQMRARSAGADVSLLKGCPPAILASNLARLISQR